MDPKHREELEHNDLEHFLTHFKEWWDKYQNPVLIAVLVVVGSFSIYTIITNNREAARNAAWSDLANSTSPEALASVAATHDHPAVRNLAALRAADKLLQRVVAGGETNPTDPAAGQGDSPAVVQNDHDPEADLREAGRLYQQVIADDDAHRVYHLNARLGLGAVAEAQQDWAAAREQYQTIIDTAGEHQPAIRGQAKTRLALLPRLKQPLVYAPAPDNPEPTGDGDTGGDPVIDEMLAPETIEELMGSTPETSADPENGVETQIDNPGLDLDVDTDLDADIDPDPTPEPDSDSTPAAE